MNEAPSPGAVAQTMGRFQVADHGTLFLDEIGDLPLELQPKLLRALQEKQFERLGGGRTFQVDVRVIAATNQDLWRMVQERKFRADLYYRLNVFPITLPPLRERGDDIPLLIEHFVQMFAKRQGKLIHHIPDEVMEVLKRHDWPGNIRELQNVIERAVIMTTGPVLNQRATKLITQDIRSARVRTLVDAERARTLSRCFTRPIGLSAGRVELLHSTRVGSGQPSLPMMVRLGISRETLPQRASGPRGGEPDRPFVTVAHCQPMEAALS